MNLTRTFFGLTFAFLVFAPIHLGAQNVTAVSCEYSRTGSDYCHFSLIRGNSRRGRELQTKERMEAKGMEVEAEGLEEAGDWDPGCEFGFKTDR